MNDKVKSAKGVSLHHLVALFVERHVMVPYEAALVANIQESYTGNVLLTLDAASTLLSELKM